MHRSLLALAGCLALQSSAAPLEKKAAAPPGGDVAILNYALTLEYLERKFYQEGVRNYTQDALLAAGFDADFYNNLVNIYKDEKTHVDFLAGALGAAAIKEPSFAFPVSDAHSFVGLSAVLEGVGVSAYLGAASAIANKDYLTVAGSILTVEARHASYIRAALKQKPFPTAFDTPLDFNQVFSLAAQFVTGFAPGTEVPFKAFPPVSITPTRGDYYCGGRTTVKFVNGYANAAKGAVTQDTPVYAVFYSGLQSYYVPVTRRGDDYTAPLPGANYASKGQPIPAGQVYVLLSTADGKTATAGDENTIAGVGIIETACKN